MTTLTIRKPDDWHVHFRDGEMLAAVAPYTARQFARAVVMPNLVPPVTTVKEAEAYRARIMGVLPSDTAFTPLMTCYLTDQANGDEIAAGYRDGVFAAVKLYPANATTNSAQGVTDLAAIASVLEKMQDVGMPLLVHGEVTDPEVDIFDREAVFIDRVLTPLLADFPGLKVVLEHITTADAVDFVRANTPRLGATVTAHHLVINRSHIFEGGIRPHRYCLPVAKRERHRLALRQAATSGEQSFFLGTDSAPHTASLKEATCGCAGVFTAPNALEVYTQVFDEEGALDHLEAFASVNGANFYGLPINEGTLTLHRKPTNIDAEISIHGGETLHPFQADRTVSWSLE
ncbi:MAG: dihydroorotase [Rhodospirillales bacterium]|nr:dihydroorotase [Rhodospirillales bacterium]MBT3907072.1 dihydroorotase [Rhodospirillaceae bacterium]MBT5035088.1 dihydroorotase [Rhodospirillaceae bacterium]MBT6222210.1 dihydroorotase [Rhodospirillaceae bacterium]MBT6360567.1 dihydroorotase [Rhodospirillaceae bacterium]